jgi:ribonuclease VapC
VIIDTSALLSIVFREPGHEELIERVQAADVVAAATPTLAETGIVMHARLGEAARGLLERLLDELRVQEIPLGEIHWREAVEAFRRFGKGQHPAGLNFGDCLTYAGAHVTGEALLFVGDDFARTDLDAAG